MYPDAAGKLCWVICRVALSVWLAALCHGSFHVPCPTPSRVRCGRDKTRRLVLRAESAGELRARYRWLYTTTESLTVRDVSQLLAAYKEVVLKYEVLAQVRAAGAGRKGLGLGFSRPAVPAGRSTSERGKQASPRSRRESGWRRGGGKTPSA